MVIRLCVSSKEASSSPANDFRVWSSENSSFDLLLTDDRKSEVLFQVSFTVLKQDSLLATSLLWQPFISEMNLLRQFAVITIGRKVQTTERSC